mmetsp:Transcript_2853/g.4603  ORF Transcript_2853/g.4603 Transcript_2853/m.4603 type:complete len:285 (-) Transcript_2853:97-951(-)|eukprot:CAMPEP_0119006886 /NCGR_PEP_ID=MMETSP1176-20130426/2615_1 /TAXON_ID=265551 /ORGANISM="Synedropsis recta cf, Strain CCMP1620" /LENGTH=284 /DNA_ID=CAMNT_0006958913 /DNA_START=189 /DNA_END=1043 /DNA_ORIENTATION=+
MIERTQKQLLWSAAAVTTSIGVYYLTSHFSPTKTRRRKRVQFVESVLEKEAASRSDTCDSDVVTPPQAMQLLRQRRSIMPKQYVDNKAVPRQVLDDMLEAARWAPSHHLTQPWHFVVFDSLAKRVQLGHFLANHYRQTCDAAQKDFSSKKFSKKIANAGKASFIVAICVAKNSRNPQLEEICSVACAVQNMHLMATAHKVGAYWSSSTVFSENGKTPKEVMEFLQLEPSEYMCLGWMFVGALGEKDKWPQGRRKPTSYVVYNENMDNAIDDSSDSTPPTSNGDN